MKNLKMRENKCLVASEHDVQKSILNLLEQFRIFHWRNNTGVAISTYKGKKRIIRYGKTGSPDIICIRNGQFIGIEVKGIGCEQSPKQIEFQQDLERAGGKYILAHSVDDVAKNL